MVNSLVLDRVTRRDLDTLYICQAANNNVSLPLSASVKIDILGKTGGKIISFISRRYWKYQDESTAATPHLSYKNTLTVKRALCGQLNKNLLYLLSLIFSFIICFIKLPKKSTSLLL